MFYDYFEKLKKVTEELAYESSICKQNDPEKKKDSCIDAALLAVLKTKLEFEELIEIRDLINSGKALNLEFFFMNEAIISLWDYIHPKVVDFAKNLFIQTPKGLGTPNAASGEGELMFILLHPNITKPTKGDLSVAINSENHIFELKASLPRVTTAVRGFTFCSNSLEIAKKYGIKPNNPNTQNASAAVEIEKKAHYDYYKSQLNSLSQEVRENFIWEWLEATGGIFPIEKKNRILSEIFKNGSFNQNALQVEIVKGFFAYMCENDNFYSMILLGDGSNVKIIPRDPRIFNKMVDTGVIRINNDYFRIAQPNTLGWYIE